MPTARTCDGSVSALARPAAGGVAPRRARPWLGLAALLALTACPAPTMPQSARGVTSGDRAPAGAEGARCRAGDRCDPLLRCDSDTRRCMVDDSIGDPYGPCYPNQTCDRGLICDVAINTCAPRPDLGQEGGLCYGNGTCDDDLSCIAGRCRVPPAR